jgi:hypothetical protein
MAETLGVEQRWDPTRPRVLVVACSDGRLQEATDEFLARRLGVAHYDRLYVPGGGGALSASNREFIRAHALRQECRFLVDAHGVERIVLLFHGPTADGPAESMCADYRRKHAWATTAQLRTQQEQDARDLIETRWQWAGAAQVLVYRCEVSASGTLAFVTLHADPPRLADAATRADDGDDGGRTTRRAPRAVPRPGDRRNESR